ncbi:MAG: alpha-amylase family glycosyl hydrolase [Anaerolineae bacterium]
MNQPASPDHLSGFPLWEFHVSREARDRYELEDTFFSFNGNVIFADFRAARVFAQRINERRDLANHPEQAVHASELNAMGLVDEVLHYMMAQYRDQQNPNVMDEALTHLQEKVGEQALDEVLLTFVEEFPPIAVYRGAMTPADYLESQTGGTSHRAVVLEEIIMLWLSNENPAAEVFLELFDDEELETSTAYPRVVEELEDFFETQPRFGPDDQTLIDMLRSPSREAPMSWSAQLLFIRERWRGYLGSYVDRLLRSLDFLEEETRPFFGPGPGPARVPDFAGVLGEPERFTPDQDWMPRVVMIAKNVYVWLDQLSKQYGREITRLDQVPDEELDLLQNRGFTALWLIGLWERSPASKRIKQMMGNPEAVASAYSLKNYTVAEDLGGEAAFEDLKDRAWRRGIRMASDMVPNHMGIDSDWMIHHPDWFLGLPHSPFPTYTFNGPDLCDDERVGVYIEDHYYERSDAAVVFKRRDHWTGSELYIYHGNDGTQMPWNDTAQLNYLISEVREAVIQTILAVARRSPIIRFDAAMTLAKRHYRRLWFPEPGTGGAIPSRAQFGMTKEQFDEAMPEEFWRQVVDRIAEELPDTLLLAEAFWLMEGYFVRTLGMHRVYNSAFMNMMRDEKNAEYRLVMKNTLEFDPEILRRYVNFMNNPDERTAVDQFGKGDKYFGVCTMMATMPGLPMFGHGQVEGYAEKYGMEYRRAYWDEKPDPHLVSRHGREIFPILHHRYLFAGVDNFYLYDFATPQGGVDENVFAYSNRVGDERALILYHNRYAETRGWIRTSVGWAKKDEAGDKSLVQTSLIEGLSLPADPGRFVVFQDAVGGLEYIRSCQELADRGLYAELHAYQTHVFVNFRTVQDDASRRYAELNAHLSGRGVPDLDEAVRELRLQPLHSPFRMLVSAPAFRWLVDHRADDPDDVDEGVLDEVEQKMMDIFRGVRALHADLATVEVETETLRSLAKETRRKLALLLALPDFLTPLASAGVDKAYVAASAMLRQGWDEDDWAMWGTLFGWLFTHRLGRLLDVENVVEESRSRFDEWLLNKPIAQALRDLDVEEEGVLRAIATIRMLLSYPAWSQPIYVDDADAYDLLEHALHHEDVRAYLRVNRYEDVVWYHKESFGDWLWWTLCLTMLTAAADDEHDLESLTIHLYTLIERLREADKVSEYRVRKLLDAA